MLDKFVAGHGTAQWSGYYDRDFSRYVKAYVTFLNVDGSTDMTTGDNYSQRDSIDSGISFGSAIATFEFDGEHWALTEVSFEDPPHKTYTCNIPLE